MSNVQVQATDFTALKILSPKGDTALGQGAFYIEGMTTAQFNRLYIFVDSVIPDGTIVYLTDTSQFQFRQGGSWQTLNSVPPKSGVFFDGTPENVLPGMLPVFSKSGDGTILDITPIIASTTGDLTLGGGITALTNSTFSQNVAIGNTLTVTGTSNFNNVIKVAAVGPENIAAGTPYCLMDNTGVGAATNKDIITLSTVSIDCTGIILADQVYTYQDPVIASSKNIKNILESDVKSEGLELFKKIPFYKYEYIDQIKYNKGTVYGLIAEELEKVLPHAVVNNKTFIPNIMQSVDIECIKDNCYKIPLKKELSDKIKLDDMVEVLDDQGKLQCKVTEINNDYIYIESDKSFVGQTFLYGTYSDCPYVIKDNVFELGMTALQKLIEIVEDQNQQIAELKIQLNNIK